MRRQLCLPQLSDFWNAKKDQFGEVLEGVPSKYFQLRNEDEKLIIIAIQHVFESVACFHCDSQNWKKTLSSLPLLIWKCQ